MTDAFRICMVMSVSHQSFLKYLILNQLTHEKNKKIYDAILGLFERGVGVDILTLGEELRRRGQIEEVGGTFYLVEINYKI